MITEWQPIMPGDKLKLKARTIYEFLRSNHTTFLAVGLGIEHEVEVDSIKDEELVAWREYECRELKSPAAILDDAQRQGKRK